MSLDHLRKMIDLTNQEIILLLSKRMTIAKEIAKIKNELNLPVHAPEREKIQMESLREFAEKNGLSPDVIEEMFTVFVSYTKRECDETRCVSGD